MSIKKIQTGIYKESWINLNKSLGEQFRVYYSLEKSKDTIFMKIEKNIKNAELFLTGKKPVDITVK